MAVLVTGCCGHLGSQTRLELERENREVVSMDRRSLHRGAMERIFEQNRVDAVIHFAGCAGKGEEGRPPDGGYLQDVVGSIILFQMMERYGVKKLVFGSSASVYASHAGSPLLEDHPLGGSHPEGRSKEMIERLLRDMHEADKSWSIAIMRSFSPAGAVPDDLISQLALAAAGVIEELPIYGVDYPTADGTGVRDYVHVADLAKGHIKALDKVLSTTGMETYNLGTGIGYSVKHVVRVFEKVSSRRIPCRAAERRPGDPAIRLSDSSKAKLELGWTAEKGLDEICADAWRRQLRELKGTQKTQESVS